MLSDTILFTLPIADVPVTFFISTVLPSEGFDISHVSPANPKLVILIPNFSYIGLRNPLFELSPPPQFVKESPIQANRLGSSVSVLFI